MSLTRKVLTLLSFILMLLTMNARANYESPLKGIYQFELSPNQKSCPAIRYNLELDKNGMGKTELVVGDTLQQINVIQQNEIVIKGTHKNNGKLLFSFQSYLLASEQYALFRGHGRYKHCKGDLKVKRTRFKNQKWKFSFIPDLDAPMGCYGGVLDVYSQMDKLVGSMQNNYSKIALQGDVTLGEKDSITGDINLNGNLVEFKGIINFRWGSAKGRFNNGKGCAGNFSASKA
jgi:hypothetical protein